MPQSMQNPRQSWASREGIVVPSGPIGPAPTDLPTDRALLVETLCRLGFSMDEHNRLGIADCFTEDAVVMATIAGERSLGTHQGREAVVDWLTTIGQGQQAQRRLLITNAVVNNLEADSALVNALFLAMVIAAGKLRPLTTGVLRAQMKKERDNAWRISRFILGFDAADG
jgi:ketosteroid isomerase-like protein